MPALQKHLQLQRSLPAQQPGLGVHGAAGQGGHQGTLPLSACAVVGHRALLSGLRQLGVDTSHAQTRRAGLPGAERYARGASPSRPQVALYLILPHMKESESVPWERVEEALEVVRRQQATAGELQAAARGGGADGSPGGDAYTLQWLETHRTRFKQVQRQQQQRRADDGNLAAAAGALKGRCAERACVSIVCRPR